MSAREKLKRELRAMWEAAAYFGAWLVFLVTLKRLILAEYHVEFSGLAAAVLGALVLAKVVVALEHVNLGAWTSRSPAWVEILVRTLLYSAGLFLVIVAEKLVDELRSGAGGLAEAYAAVHEETNLHHALANTLAFSVALLFYNFLTVLRRHLGPGGLLAVLRNPRPADEPGASQSSEPAA